MKRLIEKAARRSRRKLRIRQAVKGNAERPRITVFRSNKHLYVQVIDDQTGTTVASASSRGGETKGVKPTVEGGEKLGQAVGTILKDMKITRAVFDRNGYLYHGVVKAVAEGARKAGIQF
jgi:large subunit ribosomal protein L18